MSWSGEIQFGLQSHIQFVNRISCNEGAEVPTEHWDLKGNLWTQVSIHFCIILFIQRYLSFLCDQFSISKSVSNLYFLQTLLIWTLQFIGHTQTFKQCLLQSKSLYELYDDADLLSQNAKWRLDVVTPCMTHNKISFLINCVRMQSKGSLQNKSRMQKREWCKRKKLGREKKDKVGEEE